MGRGTWERQGDQNNAGAEDAAVAVFVAVVVVVVKVVYIFRQLFKSDF